MLRRLLKRVQKRATAPAGPATIVIGAASIETRGMGGRSSEAGYTRP